MGPVMDNVEAELTEQKDLIYEVVGETISFLNVISDCYPEAEGAGALSSLIASASHIVHPQNADTWQQMAPAGTLLN
jgi:hypothetical protein